jgi:hypothetical protein
MSDTLELEVSTGPDTRLLLRRYTAPNGRELVAVAPQIMGRDGWRLKHSGLFLAPAAARELGPALAAIAAAIDPPEPVDPVPTDESREATRWP